MLWPPLCGGLSWATPGMVTRPGFVTQPCPLYSPCHFTLPVHHSLHLHSYFSPAGVVWVWVRWVGCVPGFVGHFGGISPFQTLPRSPDTDSFVFYFSAPGLSVMGCLLHDFSCLGSCPAPRSAQGGTSSAYLSPYRRSNMVFAFYLGRESSSDFFRSSVSLFSFRAAPVSGPHQLGNHLKPHPADH